MAEKKKSSPAQEPQDDSVYRVKHISRTAWEDGSLGLPGLTPPAETVPEQPQPQKDLQFDDVAMDLAMTGEIPLELIREVLRRQETEKEKTISKRLEPVGYGPISPADIEAPAPELPKPAELAPPEPKAAPKAEKAPPARQKKPRRPKVKPEIAREPTPPPEDILAAQMEMRAMKAKSRLPEPAPPPAPEEVPEAEVPALAELETMESPAPSQEEPAVPAPVAEEAPVIKTLSIAELLGEDLVPPKPEKIKEPKPERIRESKPEKVKEPKPEKIKETKPEKIKEPKPEKMKAAKPEKVKEPKREKIKPEKIKPEKSKKSKEEKPTRAKAPKASSAQWLNNTIRLFFMAEEQAQYDFWDDNTRLYHVPVRKVLEQTYRSIYYFGLRFARPITAFARYIKPSLLYPVLAAWHLIRAAGLSFKHLTIGRAQRALQAGHEAHEARLRTRKGKLGFFAAAKDFVQDYQRVVHAAGNIMLPAAALLVLVIVVQAVSSQTYALRVTYDNNKNLQSLIASEGVFLEAQASANRYIGQHEEASSAVSEENQPAEDNPQIYAKYELVRVSPEELTSADLLCDQLLVNSPSKMVSACGIYIAEPDGENRRLAGTIRNSTEASSVLEFVKRKKTEAKNVKVNAANGDTVGFVQNVELVQGFYPEDQLLDAEELLNRLGGKVKGERYHKMEPGETLSGVAHTEGTTREYLLRINPGLEEREKTLQIGELILVEEQVDYLQVKVVRVERRKVSEPFEVENKSNSKMFKGEVRIRTKGVNGEREIIERVTYINGVRQSNPEIISDILVKKPVTEKREVGGRSTRVSYGDANYNITISMSGFVWPVPDCHRISSNYGYRKGKLHKGIDIADGHTNGKTIVAAKDGVVESVRRGGDSYGNQIVINHGGGVKTRYAHMLSGSISVSQGERVSAGQPIGRVGNTGNSTGPHCHFEVIINGSTQNPRNFVSP